MRDASSSQALRWGGAPLPGVAAVPGDERAVSSEEDRDLALRAGQGDRKAFETLVGRWWPRLGRLCAALAGYDAVAAEELAADLLVRLYLGLPRYRGDAAFGTWAWRVASIAAADMRRRLWRERRHLEPVAPGRSGEAESSPLVEVVDPSRGPEAECIRAEELATLSKAMARLSAKDRALVHLAEVEGLAGEELSRIFGVPAGTIKSRLHRARIKLGALLEEEDHEA